MEERKPSEKKEHGITLIEIMIVLAILGLVMGLLVGPRVMAMYKKGRIKTAWLECKEYEQAYAQWSAENDSECPSALDDLNKYRNKKTSTDPWGSAYVMRCGLPEPEGFGVYSLGPNKTDDDAEWDSGSKRDDIAGWKGQPKGD
jgi:general secretion pathway protein G